MGQQIPLIPADGELTLLPVKVALAVCMAKLGGSVAISQHDLDMISGTVIVEGFSRSGDAILILQAPEVLNG